MTVTVTDGDGGRAEQVVATIVIRDVVLDAGPTVSGDEGSALPFDFTGSTAPDSGLIYTVDWGDGRTEQWQRRPRRAPLRLARQLRGHGSPPSTTATAARTYADTTTATVANLAPTKAAIAEHAVGRTGDPLGFRAYWTDPVGPDPASVVTWSFGDGATASGRTAEHAYTAAGTYDVTVTVTEDDGKRVTRTDQVHVLADVDRTPSSAGREFWVTFDANYQSTDDSALTLFVASSTATSGVVEVPGLLEEFPFTVAANDVTAVSLPIDVRAGIKDTNAKRVEPLAVHVVADDAVTVYGLNRMKYTTDAFLAVPVTATGTRYRVVDYEFGLAPIVGVVATEGRTTVTIDPRSPELETHTVQLELGEVFEWETYVGQSMTGALITSDRPVSAYGANRCANIPSGYGYCDHIVEQLIPTATWGRTFASMPLAGRTQDTFRVVADEDDTVVTITDSDGQHATSRSTPASSTSSSADGRSRSAARSRSASPSTPTARPSTAPSPTPSWCWCRRSSRATPARSSRRRRRASASTTSTSPHPPRASATYASTARWCPPTAWRPIPGTTYSGAVLDIEAGIHRVTSPVPGRHRGLRLRPGRLLRLPRRLPARPGRRGEPARASRLRPPPAWSVASCAPRPGSRTRTAPASPAPGWTSPRPVSSPTSARW